MKNTKDFLEEILKNENFAKKFENIKDFEVLKEKAKSEGYDISKEELEELKAEAKNRMSDEQLDKVAGGVTKDEAEQFCDDFVYGFGLPFKTAGKCGKIVLDFLGGLFS